MGDLLNWVNLLLQVLDYLIKAGINFRDTAEGAPEWQDIVTAFEVLVNNEAGGNVSYRVEDAGDNAVPRRAKRTGGSGEVMPLDADEGIDYAARPNTRKGAK